MESLRKLIELGIKYLEQSTNPVSGFDWIIQYGLPIIQTIVLVGGAIAGLYKYYSTKNKEVNEKILREVYAPLFQYLIKQELFCFVNRFERDIEKTPILELVREKRTYKGLGTSENNYGYEVNFTTETILNLDRKEFLKVLDNVNIGLASKELFTLLSMYQVLIYIEDKYNETTDGYLNSTIMKVDVENALRAEIIRGYNYYHKKLGLKTLETSKFYKIKGDKIIFTYEIDEDKKNESLNEIMERSRLSYLNYIFWNIVIKVILKNATSLDNYICQTQLR